VSDRFQELLRRLGELQDVEKTGQVLGWDEETKMPALGADARAEQRATIARIAHELQTAPELGDLLEELRPYEESQPFESFEASLIRVARNDFEKAVRVPADLRADLSRLASRGYRAWLRARDEKDYAVLLPYLEQGLELRRQYVECFAPYDDPYDPLLDIYEPGMKTNEVEPIFDRLKEGLVPMIKTFADDGGVVDDSCLLGHFPRDAQRRFSLAMLEQWGMERDSWRLDYTVHPFMTCFSPSDIRLTTNFHEDSLHGVLSCLHEFGHGVYERNVDPRYARTPLAEGVSSAFHESASRMWENLVGRSISTWRFFYPKLQAELPSFAAVPLDTFHRALNKVEPTKRRVDSDEVTYCLHIILRFELERAMLSGDLDLRDLPEAFDAKMRDYLGLQPPDIVAGALQDAHWSDLTFGYFPTYALGNVVSVQLWEKAEAAVGPLDEQFERGEFAPLREWLTENVYRWGRVFTPQELLQRATGSAMDPEPYLRYLERKIDDLIAAPVA
jgi:carboxypeptidase Taq